MSVLKKVPGSYRDPSGFLFYDNNTLYRQINLSYKDEYQNLMASGLYQCLTDQKLLLPHREAALKYHHSKEMYKIIQPECVPCISYPYEWCFSQLQDAALTTLSILKISLRHNMILKDSSAFNIMFFQGEPVLIDTLSFTNYQPGKPWIAYKQFCEHFLAPLALMYYKDLRLNKLLQQYPDGIPLDLTSKLLPLRSWFNHSILIHIHLHAKGQKYFSSAEKTGTRALTPFRLKALVDSLEAAITKMKLPPKKSAWIGYYSDHSYSTAAFSHKKTLISELLAVEKEGWIWDLGANTGLFCRLGGTRALPSLAIDNDPLAVEHLYLECKEKGIKEILPLYIDITNPTPALGFANQERSAFLSRGPADILLVLAMLHHLCMTHNIPFDYLASCLQSITRQLIIEFVPKNDPAALTLLRHREDIFVDYTGEHFEEIFSRYFRIKKSFPLNDSLRTIYLMETK